MDINKKFETQKWSNRDILCGTARMFYAKWSNPQEVREVEKDLASYVVIVTPSLVWSGFMQRSYERRVSTGHEVLSWVIGAGKYIYSWCTENDEHMHNWFAKRDRSSPCNYQFTFRGIAAQVDNQRKERRELEEALAREPAISLDLTQTFEF